jgi:PTS system cellobiose-specific IIA component
MAENENGVVIIDDDKMDEIIMSMVCTGGDARGLCIEAIRSARVGDFAKAEDLLKQADDDILQAHQTQTELIQNEINGTPMVVRLMMVHAQDHIMDAMVVRDLSGEIIENLRTLSAK